MSPACSNLGFPELSEVSSMLVSGNLSSVELTECSLSRIDALNEHLHAFVDVFREEALAAAKAADLLIRAGFWLGPLHGVPVALKDNMDVHGRLSRAGSPLLEDRTAHRNAWIAQRLLECGAVVVGKTHMVELGLGTWGTNEYMGTPRNPWGASEHLTPGGSSSGSAVAVASGMVPLAFGTDTGGSIRIPAAMCGITGFKPTKGRFSTDGVVPMSTTFDSVGFLTQTAADAELVYTTLASNANCSESHVMPLGEPPTLQRLRVAYLEDTDLTDVQPDILDAYELAKQNLSEQGAYLQPLQFFSSFDEIVEISNTVIVAEALATWGHLASSPTQPMDSAVRSRLLAARNCSALEYVNACRGRDAITRQFENAARDFDVIVTPATQWTARRLHDVDASASPVRYSRFVNLLDLCAISVPMGWNAKGLPMGLQIAGPSGGDMRVLRVARAYQNSTAWHSRRWPGRQRSAIAREGG